MIKYLRLGLICTSLFGAPVFAETLTYEDVLKSSHDNFPLIQASIADIEAAQGGIKEARGAFDLVYNQSFYDRFRGFYDGRLVDGQVVKPIGPFNAEFAVGYRQSDGNFPIYQDYYFTNDKGEASFQAAFSLLRDRAIDSDRLDLLRNEIELDQANISLLSQKLNVQGQSLKSYVNWLAAGFSLKVYEGLLDIALKRESALKKRAEAGDVADIAVTENTQFILQRKEILEAARRDLIQAENLLRLYYQNDVITSDMPRTFPRLYAELQEDIDQDFEQIAARSPELNLLATQKELAEATTKMGENNILPRLDVELYNAEDFGNGSVTREGFESTVTVNLSVPLQRRFGQGQIDQGRARAKKVFYQAQFERDQLAAFLKNNKANIDTAQKILSFAKAEQKVAQKLEEAERQRFNNGQSDFFLVNIREVNTANAKIKTIEAKQNYLNALADFLVSTVNTDALLIQ